MNMYDSSEKEGHESSNNEDITAEKGGHETPKKEDTEVKKEGHEQPTNEDREHETRIMLITLFYGTKVEILYKG